MEIEDDCQQTLAVVEKSQDFSPLSQRVVSAEFDFAGFSGGKSVS